MFWHKPCLPIDFYFPTIRAWRNTGILTNTLLSYMNDCEKPSRKHKQGPHLRLRDRSGTMTERLMPFFQKQATWSWLSLTPTRGEESEGLVGGGTIQSGMPDHWQFPLVPCEEPVDRMLMSPPPKPSFTHHSCKGYSPLYGHVSWAGRVHYHHPRRTNFR